MTWIDIIILIIMVSLVIQGIISGLIRGVFDIAGIILGYLLAINYNEAIKIPKFLAFLLIFILVVIIVSLLGRIISKLIHITPLGPIDRILGGILGFVKGFVVCFVFLIMMFLIKKSDETLSKSEIAPWILKGGITASQIMPQKWYQWIKKTVTKRELVECQKPNVRWLDG